MSEKTREQLEAELEDLRADLARVEAAEAVIQNISKKHGTTDSFAIRDLKTKIYRVEIKIDPTRLAVDHAKKILADVRQPTPVWPRSSGAVALARAFLELKGISVDAE